MNKIDIDTWEEFKISEIFITEKKGNTLQVPTGASIPKRFLLDGHIPRVSATNINNGILGFYEKADCKEYRLFDNFISVSFLGTTFYHDYTASLDMKIHCLQLKNKQLNKYIAFFLISIIRKVISNTEYSDQISSTILPNLKIKLPVSNSKTPNWEYMENFIKQLETRERDSSSNISRYLSKLKQESNLYLTNKILWEEFEISELFNINPTKYHKLINKDLLEEDGVNPVVVNSSYNNGIGGFTNQSITEKGNVITFSDTTNSASIFYQPDDFVGYSHVQVLKPIKHEIKWTRESLLFFTCVFKKKASLMNYDYVNKFTRIDALNLKIKLPVSNPKTPNWEYMENFIKEIEVIESFRIKNIAQKIIAKKNTLNNYNATITTKN